MRSEDTLRNAPAMSPNSAGNANESPNHSAHMPLLVGRKRAAELLGIGERKAWELGNRGVIRTVRIGSRRLYDTASIRDWVARGCPDPIGGGR